MHIRASHKPPEKQFSCTHTGPEKGACRRYETVSKHCITLQI